MVERAGLGNAIAVIGAGYVGLTTAACLAHLGNRVACVDTDRSRIARLKRGEIDLREPGMDGLIAARGKDELSFHDRFDVAADDAGIVFLCLPTPGLSDGSTDLRSIEQVTVHLRSLRRPPSVVVVKSTVPPGTARELADAVGPDAAVVSNPEFLREGSAVHDFLHPDRVVIGADCPVAARRVAELYAEVDAPVLRTDPTSAEIIKHGANFFLAMKLSYANMLAELCDHLGANITDVLRAVGRDPRIGSCYLRPGPGWGGPCLPKDVRALAALESALGAEFSLVTATLRANVRHRRHIVEVLEQSLGRAVAGCRIGILGLAFKPGTDDLRDSPALAITAMLAELGAQVTAHDPAITAADPRVPDHVALASDAAAALDGCHCALVLTGWPEFRELPWNAVAERMSGRAVVDTRDCLDSGVLARAGLDHRRIGAPRSDDRAAAAASP